MVGAAARSTPTDSGLALHIPGRTYSVRDLVDVLPLRGQTRFWAINIWVGLRMTNCRLVTLEHWMRRAGGAPMLGRAGPSINLHVS